MTYCFFGHGSTPPEVFPYLLNAIRNCVQKDDSARFLVGSHGNFDFMALRCLRTLRKEYPATLYYVVLAYLPKPDDPFPLYEAWETLYPEGIEYALPRYAISWPNRWMVQQSDSVICYITRHYGGAAQFVKYAKTQGKQIINLADEMKLS